LTVSAGAGHWSSAIALWLKLISAQLMVNRAMGRPNVEIIVLRIDGVMQNLRAPGNRLALFIRHRCSEST
jgi:hypothetical protein